MSASVHALAVLFWCWFVVVITAVFVVFFVDFWGEMLFFRGGVAVGASKKHYMIGCVCCCF